MLDEYVEIIIIKMLDKQRIIKRLNHIRTLVSSTTNPNTIYDNSYDANYISLSSDNLVLLECVNELVDIIIENIINK